ncbi:MAG: hypothetical protein P8104_09320, partial [Gammaproteobacteria bacterium]
MKDSLQALLHGNIKEALKNAKEAREHLIKKLNTYAVQNWLLSSDDTQRKKQVEFIQKNLVEMQTYLNQKMSIHKEIRKNIMNGVTDKQSESAQSQRKEANGKATLLDLFNREEHKWRDSTPPEKWEDQSTQLKTLSEANFASQKLLLQYDKDLATDKALLIDIENAIEEAENILSLIN